MRFRPEEILFSPTTQCNLKCGHCDVRRSKDYLPVRHAIRFLKDSRRHGIKHIGFTGGEPFLRLPFLCAVTESAIDAGMFFDRIMTNGAWFRNNSELASSLLKLHDSGYDGSISVSVDAFHGQDLKKVASFIRKAARIWRQKDIITITYVGGSREADTKNILKRLARLLNGRLSGFPAHNPFIKNSYLFIKIYRIDLSPVGKASCLKDPWDGKWFGEDHCKGPGNVFFVLPNGDVKPCCGYATDNKVLTIGNIKRDTVKNILTNIEHNRFIRTVFGSGLKNLREKLKAKGVCFPGRTSNHCYFCDFILKNVNKSILDKCLD